MYEALIRKINRWKKPPGKIHFFYKREKWVKDRKLSSQAMVKIIRE
jgi:hypothetical protein